MLDELTIRNYALIDSITLSFKKGFNVLTGETGAGKSIIVGSLSFLMGAKTEPDVIRSGCEEASVSACLSVNKNKTDVLSWLKARDIDTDDDEETNNETVIIVRRNIKTTGRGTAFIQNVPVTRQDLAEFMGMLFDLHGQHNHESLLRKDSHRILTDRFAGIENEVRDFSKTFLELADKRKTLEASLKSEKEREERLDILNYAVDEISKAKIHTGEIRELEQEAQKLSDFEKLAGLIHSAAGSFIEGDQSIISLARRVKNTLDSASSVDSSLGGINRRFENLYYEAQDIAGDFRSYRDSLSFDPQRLDEVNDRLSLLYKLKKKYVKSGGQGNDEEAVLSYMTDAQAEIDALAGSEENRVIIKKEIGALEKLLVSKAQNIKEKRTKAASALGGLISSILKNLGMPSASFEAAVIAKQNEDRNVFGLYGTEDIEFMISANKGEPLKNLAKIASGGELSRVMLAIKTALLSGSVFNEGTQAEENRPDADVQTLVFDEIDTGIGGEVALKVGDYLSQIGGFKQIFCVTHLASIAVRADNHFKVEKKVEGGRTYTGIGPLSADGRRKEIARMLAGDAGSAALAHAGELMRKYSGRSS